MTVKTSNAKIVKLLPEELIVVTDTKHPLYDPRVSYPVNVGLRDDFLRLGFDEDYPLLGREVEAGIEVLDGRQRTAALRDANKVIAAPEEPGNKDLLAKLFGDDLSKIPTKPILAVVKLTKAGDGQLSDLYGKTIVGNLHRTGDTPLVEAQKIAHYIELCKADGKTEAEAFHNAVTFWPNMTIDTMKNRLKLNEAPKAIKDELKAGTVTPSDVIRVINTTKDKEERTKLFESITRKDPTSGAKRRAGKRGTTTRPTQRQIEKIGEALGAGCTKKVNALLALKFFAGKDKKGEFLKELGVQL